MLQQGIYSNAHNAPRDCSIERTTVADELVELSRGIVSRADEVSGRSHNKLSPVMTPPYPKENACQPEAADREWPPLFAELRSNLFSILVSLRSIDEALDRTEL